jgi:hypothetical protein
MTMISTAEMVPTSYGAEEGLFPLVGKTVAQAWLSLKAVFNIPGHALTRVNGSPASPSQRLCDGDSVEFFVERGSKGVGDHVWSQDEFISLFQMEPSDWDQWRDEGLPVQNMPSGIRLVETEVDAWLADRRAQGNYRESLDRNPPSWFKLGQWYRLPYEVPPANFRFGPLEGTLQQIAAWMFPALVDDKREGNKRCERATRRLEKRATYGNVWVRRNTNSSWEAWLRNEREYAQANQNRLRDQVK